MKQRILDKKEFGRTSHTHLGTRENFHQNNKIKCLIFIFPHSSYYKEDGFEERIIPDIVLPISLQFSGIPFCMVEV